MKLNLEEFTIFGIHFPSEGLEEALESEHRLFLDNLTEYKIDDLKGLLDLPVRFYLCKKSK